MTSRKPISSSRSCSEFRSLQSSWLRRAGGVWDVIDGLQRLGTILQFVGVKKDEAGNKLDPLILRKTKSLPSLEGKIWENPEQPDDPQSLTGAQRLLIKRSSLDITIVLKESDEQSRVRIVYAPEQRGVSYIRFRRCVIAFLSLSTKNSSDGWTDCVRIRIFRRALP